jgi:hypothetical protein
MESRFGQDFSQVRIHTNGTAAGSAESINANAYTYGPNIVFNQGQYQPDTNAGRRLLAHELVHVVQQSAMSHSQSGTMVQRLIVPRPCDKNPMIPCPPDPASSPIPNCGNRSHESILIEAAKMYVSNEIDSSATTGVMDIGCFGPGGIGACQILFDSGIAVEASVLLGYTTGGTVFVKEIVPPGGTQSITDPLGPRCSYEVDCPSTMSITFTPSGCRPQPGQPIIDPGELYPLPDDQRYA